MRNIYQLAGTQRMIEGRHGNFIYNHNDLFVGKALELYGEYGEHEVQLFEQLVRSESVVIEVGANIGSQTIALSRLVGERGLVYAFEPQPIIFQNLCANLSVNSLKNVRAFPFACGDSSGYVTIPAIDYESEGNFGGVSMQVGKEEGEVVTLVKLDSWFEANNVSLIKIDVEGMEQSVISGLEKTIDRCKPFIYVENDRVNNAEALIEFIWSLSYKCYWHTPTLYNKNNYYNNDKDIYKNIISVNMLCIHESGPEVNGLNLIIDAKDHPFKK